MWNFLGDQLMRKLKNKYDEERNIYATVIRDAETKLQDEKITGHEAAKLILESIFSK